MEEKRIVIIDGNSLINRAYYAIQRPMITKEGLYTQAVYGFLNMVNKIQKEHEPGMMVVAFDRKAPTFRHLEYTEYKAGRRKMPPELAMQFPLLKEALEYLDIAMLEIDGFEADDILGTVAKRAEEQGYEPLIITGDRDALQLASQKTRVMITKKGISDFEIYDYDTMMEKYGFSPEQFIDYKGLMGDSSDNIPGLPGVGEKTAMKLMAQFGSIANMIAHTEDISNAKLRQKIEENAQLAVMSRRLATIVTDVPLELDFTEFKIGKPDFNKLIELYRKLEFNSFLKKMPTMDGFTAFSEEAETVDAVKSAGQELAEETVLPELKNSVMIETADGMLSLAAALRTAEDPVGIKVFSDHNHIGAPDVCGVYLRIGDSEFYLQTEKPDVLAALKECFRENKKLCCIGHQLQQDYYALLGNGFEPGWFKTFFDTAVGQYLLEPARSGYELKTLMLEYFHEEISDEKTFNEEIGQLGFLESSDEKRLYFARQWCGAALRLTGKILAKIREKELSQVLEEIELPLILVLADMEKQGFAVDRNELEQAGVGIHQRIDEITKMIYAMSGKEFNINSPKQLGVVLFEDMELPGAKKTKTGYATGAEILDRLKDVHPIIDLILEYRMLMKLAGTYIDGLLPLIDPTGKIHAHFQQTVTATGRISCTEPNLQNIPVKQELGRSLRKAFIPESSDYTLVGADYSQIELRVLAHMSGDPSLIEAFNQGQDIHRATAARVFDVPEAEVSPLQRSNAKAVNFGVIYGMSGFGLSSNLNITRKEAEKYIQEYFKKHTSVKQFMDDQVAQGKKQGFVTTLFSRRREIPEIHASNYMVRQAGERLAMNSPIQGTAADIIKLAMIRVHRELEKRKMKSSLILQVHDELIIQTAKEELEEIRQLLAENMEQAAQLQVKLSVDLNTGENWYLLK